eukprot:s2639_g20.t1
MMKEMNSMKDFDVYDEVLVKDCTDEQVNVALDCRRVKVWKNETDLRCRVVVRGCFQNVEKNEEDNLFASVTMRLLLCMAMSRNWGITLRDVSTAFLHAAMSGEVYVWPPKEFYPNGDCDIAYATKELSRDVTAPTMQSVAKLKHLLRYLIGTKMCVLRLRPSYQLSDGNCSLDVNVYVDSDWAGCSKTRKSTSGSTVNILGCNMVSAARTQGIGQGVSEALFLRSMLLEAKLAKKVNVIAHTDSTAGKSMATGSTVPSVNVA